MKKLIRLITYTVGVLASLFLYTSCIEKDVVATNLELINNAPSEILVGEFDYSNYELKVTYSDGTTKTIVVDETMVPEDEYLKTFLTGTNTIKVNYENLSIEIPIDVKQYTFDDDIYFPEVIVFYDGQYHSIEVEGNIPKGTNITYTNGNSFKNAQEYKVVAVLANDLYVTKTITGKFTIKKSTFDVSSIKFEDKEFVYDGTEKSIEVTGAPKDLNITYSIGQATTNKATTAGVYEVIAHIDAGVNYEEIEDLHATLTIKKGTYDMSSYKFANKTVTYTGDPINIYITNENLLPAGVSVVYENNGNINAGKYEVRAKFIGDNINYEPISDQVATLTIKKATYNLTGIYLDSESFVFDTKPHSIYYTGTLPTGVSFIGYENNAQVNAGVYTVLAKFAFKDTLNYEPITPISGTLEITKSDLNCIVFNNKEVEYSGKNYTISCEGVPAGVTVKYSIDGVYEGSVKEPGTYTFNASFEYDEVAANNYNPHDPISATLIIKKKTLQTGFTNSIVTYDGQPHTITCQLTTTEQEYIDVSYWISDGSGNMIAFTDKTEPGSYLVYAHFEITDETQRATFNAHYNELTDQSATLIIDKVHYQPVFTNQVLAYTGAPLEVTYDESDLVNNPNLAFEAISYSGNKQTNKGVYHATASFYLTENAKKYYYDISEQPITYVIVTNVNVAEVSIYPTIDNGTVVYDGSAHSISVSGLPEEISVDYLDNSQIMPGAYEVTVIFTYDDPIIKHYYELPIGTGAYYSVAGEDDKVFCSVALTIEKKLYNVKYTNNDRFAYDGTNKTISLDESEKFVTATFEYADEERIIPGTYSVTCKPKIIDGQFNSIYRVEDSVVTFTIVKADVNFSYQGLTVYYDGNPKYIKVLGLPDGMEATTIGDGQTKVGTYQVEVTFTNNTLYYNDIEAQLETLTILSNVVSPAGLITYLGSSAPKSVEQFSTLRGLLAKWIDLNGFRVDWSVDYFKGLNEQYPIIDEVRHGSSKYANDFTFTESTNGDEYVKVTLKLTLKEGYEIQDGSMGKTYNSIITIYVGQTEVIDITNLANTFGDSGVVTSGDSLLAIFEENVPNFELVDLVYSTDYYKGNTKYTEKQGNIHVTSSNKEDFIFTIATWGDRTCNVTYSLEIPKGYSLFDGNRSYQKYEKTCKVMVNPLNEVDTSYIKELETTGYTVIQYSKLGDAVKYMVDTNHLDVSWYVYKTTNYIKGSSQMTIGTTATPIGNSTTDYAIESADALTIEIIIKTKDNYTIKNCESGIELYTINLTVTPRSGIYFTSFDNSMKNTEQMTIYQYYDYFNDVIGSISIPDNTTYVITINDVNGKSYAYETLDTFTFDEASNGTKVKVDFEFYPNDGYVLIDENSLAVDYRKFTYEYTISAVNTSIPNTAATTIENVFNELNGKTIEQYTTLGQILPDSVKSVISTLPQGSYNFEVNGKNCMVPMSCINCDYNFMFNLKNNQEGINNYNIIITIQFDKEDGLALTDENDSFTYIDLYHYSYSFDIVIEPVVTVNESYINNNAKTFTINTYDTFNTAYKKLTLNNLELKSLKIYDSTDGSSNLVYNWNSDEENENLASACSYRFVDSRDNAKYYAKMIFATTNGTYYVLDNDKYKEVTIGIYINIDPRIGINCTKTSGFIYCTNSTTQFESIKTYVDNNINNSYHYQNIFKNYYANDNYDFISHLKINTFSLAYTEYGNYGRYTTYDVGPDSYSNMAKYGFAHTGIVDISITYCFDDNKYIFVNNDGTVNGVGTTYNVTYRIAISQSTKNQLSTNNLWDSNQYYLTTKTVDDYIDYYESLNGNNIKGTAKAVCYYVLILGSSSGNTRMITTSSDEKLVPNALSYYLSIDYEIVDKSKNYFYIDQYGKPVYTYSKDCYINYVKIPIVIDDASLRSRCAQIPSLSAGTRIFDFDEHYLEWSYELAFNNAHGWETFKGASNDSFYMPTMNSDWWYYEVDIDASAGSSKYCFLQDQNSVFGSTFYTFHYTNTID